MHGFQALHCVVHVTGWPASLAQGSLKQPGAGRDDRADKRLSRMVAKYVQEVSYYLSEDDFKQMAAARL